MLAATAKGSRDASWLTRQNTILINSRSRRVFLRAGPMTFPHWEVRVLLLEFDGVYFFAFMEVERCNPLLRGACWLFCRQFPIHAGARDVAIL